MLKLATVFSGIGAIEQALKQMNIEYEIVFACDNGERYLTDEKVEELKKKVKRLSNDKTQKIVNEYYDNTGKENFVKKSYFANYDISEDRWYEDIRFLKGKKYKGQIDLLVGRKSLPKLFNFWKKRWARRYKRNFIL